MVIVDDVEGNGGGSCAASTSWAPPLGQAMGLPRVAAGVAAPPPQALDGPFSPLLVAARIKRVALFKTHIKTEVTG